MNEQSTGAAPVGPAPIRPQIVPEQPGAPLRIILEQPGTRLGRFGRKALWVILGISLLVNLRYLAQQSGVDDPLPEKYHSLNRRAVDKVAILAVKGPIGGEERYVQRQIEQIRHDDNVKAVVLRIESPGGTITGSDYIYHHVKELVKEKQIPLVVSMGSIAASGGYYVAMAAGDKRVLYAEPTTWTGSIGVIIPHYDLSDLLEKIEVKDDSISSHPLKQMGSLTRKFPPDVKEKEQEILKELVDESFSSFKELVLTNRTPLKENAAAQEQVFTGRIFTAGQAKNLGLVDELGYIEDAIKQACKLANIDPDETRAIEYDQQQGLVDQLMWGRSAPRRALSPWELFDFTSPQAYYLCSWMPSWTLGRE